MVCAKRFYLIILTVFSLSVTAQNFEEYHSGSWLEFYGNNILNEKWSIPFAGILKHHYLFEMYDFSFIRTGVSYRLNPRSVITGGIAYVNSKVYNESSRSSSAHQYWLYEEFVFEHNLEGTALAQRWRLEHRWINQLNDINFRNRLRYRLRLIRPIYGKTFIKTSNEVFFNLNGASFFNQNRFYIGIGRELTPTLKVDLGYLKNHFKYRHHDTIRISFAYTIDFTRKEAADIIN